MGRDGAMTQSVRARGGAGRGRPVLWSDESSPACEWVSVCGGVSPLSRGPQSSWPS